MGKQEQSSLNLPKILIPILFCISTALDDCYEALNNIKRMYPDSKITVTGESAGANLCLALALKAKAPLISPLFGDYSGFPPTFITCDLKETLASDSEYLYEKLQQAGIDVQMIVMKNTFHAFATIGTGTPETKALLEDNVRFMKRTMG